MATFRSEEEAQTAKALGFVPPKNPMVGAELPKEKTTTVLGFFNANPWPVHISISALGITLHLEQRGQFVKDGDGNRVNDPILEQYVGPGQLSKEISPKAVPYRLFVRPTPHVQVDSQHSVHQAAGLKDSPHGTQGIPMPRKLEGESLPFNALPYVGMSMEEARRLRLVKPVTESTGRAPKDSDGQPVSGDKLPTIEDETPRDLTPGEYRRWLAQRGQSEDSVDRPVTQVSIEKREAEVLVPPVAEPESPAQVSLQNQIVAASSDKSILNDAVMAALKTNVAVPEPASSAEPTPLASAPVIESLPKPQLDAPLPKPQLTEPEPADRSTPVKKARFMCLVDGKGFDFRSQLLAYAKRKHPGRVDEIMQPYPVAR